MCKSIQYIGYNIILYWSAKNLGSGKKYVQKFNFKKLKKKSLKCPGTYA